MSLIYPPPPVTEIHHEPTETHYQNHYHYGSKASSIAQWLIVLLLLLIFLHEKGWAQSPVTIQGAPASTTPASTATVTANSSTHRGLDVNVLNAGSGGTASQFGQAYPSTGTAAGATDGTNMQPLAVDGSDNLKVNCETGCAGGSATPTDSYSNPTTAGLQMGFQMLWNGSSWDRWYGDKTNGAWVNIKSSVSLGVTGTFWQATQPVSGTFWQATQPVSAASLPLPTGAATSAKQPALGTAGSASADVLSVQGVASMTALKVDGSGVTQPVSWTSQTVTATPGTGVFEVGPTSSANTVSNPFFSQPSDGTHGATFNSTATASKYAQDFNILSILGTAPTTAGFLDIKAADGNVYVRSNAASTFPVTATPNSGSVFEVGPTGSANTASNPFFNEVGDGTHTVTLNSTTYTSKYGLDANLLGTLGTAFSTPGFVDIKGANGNVISEIGDGSHTVTLNSTTYTSKYGLDANLLGTLGTAFSTAGKIDITATAGAGQGATGSSVPSGATYIGGNGTGNLTGMPMCDTWAVGTDSSSGETAVVNLTSSKAIHVCSFMVNSASTTAVTAQLTESASNSCTSVTNFSILVPLQAATSTAPVGQNIGMTSNTNWATTSAYALCLNLSAAQSVNYQVNYTVY